ncbi:choline ABC transporter permease subunit [Pannonibacter indicus]|uniref:choline ABC transporter permease subunit n=1 Tax=Pannonibacter indicus TaxID=466044 RepID=UPI0006E189A7|nr:choline ABC transporter permease subunit [Pannonibacter indicus]
MEWLTSHKLPIGPWARSVVDWLTTNAYMVFDAISYTIEAFIGSLLWVLKTPHPLTVVAAVTVLAYVARRNIGFPLLVLGSLLLIINQGYWTATMDTLALVLGSTAICMAVGVPIGVVAAHNPRFYAFLQPVQQNAIVVLLQGQNHTSRWTRSMGVDQLDLMQTIPTFVYLIPALILFGLGMVPGLIATVIFALPAPIRLTQLGVSSTPTQLVEAGEAFGTTRWQLLWKVELPYALPQIMAGLTQTIMLSLSMVVIAALVGANGLGVPTLRALNSVNIAMGFEVGVAIVLVAIVLDRFFKGRSGKTRKGGAND